MARLRPIYLLDTNIASFILKGHSSEADIRLCQSAPGTVFISAVTRAELRYGVLKKPEASRLAALVSAFLLRIPTLSWTEDASEAYGALRAELERKGRLIGNMDMMIAAHALALGAVLATNNRRDFQRIRGLQWEDWSARTR